MRFPAMPVISSDFEPTPIRREPYSVTGSRLAYGEKPKVTERHPLYFLRFKIYYLHGIAGLK